MNDITFFKRIPVGFIRANCYIISGDKTNAVLIDPGGDYEKLKTVLDGSNLRAEAVLLTHGHYDHHRAAKQFQDAGAKIYMHAADREIIPYIHGFVKPVMFEPDFDVSDGETLSLAGLEIKVMHTPGHSKGGVCYYINNVLFTGDTLFHGDVGRTDLPGGNAAALRESIRKKLYALPDDTVVYPGHEEETTIGEEKRFNNYVRSDG